jgi:hypothetical protein
MDMLDEEKHASLLGTFVNYRRKEVYTIWPCGIYYKNITIVNENIMSDAYTTNVFKEHN